MPRDRLHTAESARSADSQRRWIECAPPEGHITYPQFKVLNFGLCRCARHRRNSAKEIRTVTITEIAVEHATDDAQPAELAVVAPATGVAPATDGATPSAVPSAVLLAEVDGIELVLVDPGELIIGINVRKAPVLGTGFANDIGKRGVREPIIARRDEMGRLVVRKGQKRTLAAVEKGVPRVLVVVEPELLDDDTARTIDRIIDQLGENEHRAGITLADEVLATQELLDLGLSATKIAELRSLPRPRVRTLVTVAKDEVATQAVSDGILDLTQAAVLAEFSTDEAAVARLTECARKDPDQFDHVVSQLRDEREEAAAIQAAAAELTEQGITVIDKPDSLRGQIRLLEELRRSPTSKVGVKLTPARHAKCPGHAAYVKYRGWVKPEDRVSVHFVCTAFEEHGHAEVYAREGAAARPVSSGSPGRGRMTEEQKLERRTVVRNGKAWDSATKVRLAWLKTFAARKTPPKDAVVWMTQMIAQGSHDMREAMAGDHQLAVTLLGLATKSDRTRYDRRSIHPIADAAAKATPARASMLTLVMMLAALEERTDRRRTWERPSREAVAYFTKIKEWGYALSPVEELALNNGTPATTPSPIADPIEAAEVIADSRTADDGPDSELTADDGEPDTEATAIVAVHEEIPTAASAADLAA
jgi:ParB family chromosome partitioning protein